jgi:hypothetical protein
MPDGAGREAGRARARRRDPADVVRDAGFARFYAQYARIELMICCCSALDEDASGGFWSAGAPDTAIAVPGRHRRVRSRCVLRRTGPMPKAPPVITLNEPRVWERTR